MFSTGRICRHFALALLVCVILTWPAVPGRFLFSGEVRIKNGTTFRGISQPLESLNVGPKKPNAGPIPIYPVMMVATPLKRYFVPLRQVDIDNKDVDLSRHVGFKLEQRKMRDGSRILASVSEYLEKPEPFDEWGRRRVVIRSSTGADQDVFQGVTVITPEYLRVIALNFTWETAIATSSVPVEQLDHMLRKVTVQKNPDDRLKIATFYIQAALYGPAERELASIAEDFPELVQRVADTRVFLAVAQAQELLSEMKLRYSAGQHQFVYEWAKKFPTENIDAPTLREVREITTRYEAALARSAQAKVRMGELQAALKTDQRVKEIAPLRAQISEKLKYSNLDRLEAFLKLAADPLLKPEEKLALALSGWVVGSPNAVTDLDQALKFWQARQLVLDYLRSAQDADVERKAIFAKLEALEGVGPEQIGQMLPLLAPPRDPIVAAPGQGQALRIEVAPASDAPTCAYWLSLPFEYHTDHAYPLIVALHDAQGTPQQELQGFWGGNDQSQRRGYIVISPEYVPQSSKNKHYDFSPESHQIVINSLRDALLRLNVDADRVFLSGHGMGGDAAWDMGLSHPHLFAGVVPINAAIDHYAPLYLDNGKQLPLYTIAGELDGNLMERNVGSLMKMMQNNFDLIYAEYNGAGPGTFYSEIHALFDWMSRLRRGPPPRQVNAKTLRESDNSFWWFEFSGIPENMKGINWANPKQQAIHALKVTATITPGNTINVSSRAASHTIWLPRGDGLVDFNARLHVRINGKQVWNDFVKPDLAAMLDHVRVTGDRQHLYWGVLEFGR
jgi:pimeloyl-ACP methyl ester carboxylesterase